MTANDAARSIEPVAELSRVVGLLGAMALSSACSAPTQASVPLEPTTTGRPPPTAVALAPPTTVAIPAPPATEPAPVATPGPAFALVATPTDLPASDPLALWLAPRVDWGEGFVGAWPADVRYVRAHVAGHDVIVLSRAADATEQSGCIRGPTQRVVAYVVDGEDRWELPVGAPDTDDDVLPVLYAGLFQRLLGWGDLCFTDACIDEVRARWGDQASLLSAARPGVSGHGRETRLRAIQATTSHTSGGRHGRAGTSHQVQQIDAELDENGNAKFTDRTLADRFRADPTPEPVRIP